MAWRCPKTGFFHGLAGDVGQHPQCRDNHFAPVRLRRLFYEKSVQLAVLARRRDGIRRRRGIARCGSRAFRQPGAQFAVEMASCGLGKIVARRQPFQDGGTHEAADATDGTSRQIGAQRQRHVPGIDLLACSTMRSIALADFGVVIDEQRRHRRDIQRLRQLVADVFAQRLAASDSGQRFLNLVAGDHFDQAGI